MFEVDGVPNFDIEHDESTATVHRPAEVYVIGLWIGEFPIHSSFEQYPTTCTISTRFSSCLRKNKFGAVIVMCPNMLQSISQRCIWWWAGGSVISVVAVALFKMLELWFKMLSRWFVHSLSGHYDAHSRMIWSGYRLEARRNTIKFWIQQRSCKSFEHGTHWKCWQTLILRFRLINFK